MLYEVITIQGTSSTTGDLYLNDIVDKLYINNPDKKQLLPIMNQSYNFV